MGNDYLLEVFAGFPFIDFEDSPRLIVGTGDHVAAGIPDEYIFAMIETVRHSSSV